MLVDKLKASVSGMKGQVSMRSHSFTPTFFKLQTLEVKYFRESLIVL